MFDADLSEQHSSLYGTTRFATKAKETSWGTGISNKFMQVTKNGAFTGISLSEGGDKPPQDRLESPMGINIWTIEDDTAYAERSAKEIPKEEQKNIQIGGIDETDFYYEIVFIQDGNIGSTQVKKDLSNPVVTVSNFLTFSDGEVPARLKTISIDENRFLMVFEVWDSAGYQYTAYMRSDESEIVKICNPIRLHRSMPLLKSDTIKMLGTSTDSELLVYEFDI